MTTPLKLAALLLPFIALASCDDAPEKKEERARVIAPAKIELPEIQAQKSSKIPDQYEPGVYSVAGVRKKFLKDTSSPLVKVRGVVRSFFRCPPCTTNGFCKACTTKSHLRLTDSPESAMTNDLIVSVCTREFPKVKSNTVYTAEGPFTKEDGLGFSDTRGLIGCNLSPTK